MQLLRRVNPISVARARIGSAVATAASLTSAPLFAASSSSAAATVSSATSTFRSCARFFSRSAVVAAAATTAASSSSSSSASLQPNGSLSLTVRPSASRGHANLGWLNSSHSFSFASYHDSNYMGVHSLRVINEDRVKGGEGFVKHPHKEFEIFSFVVKGALKHNDSLGNEEILPRGSVQFTSAGTGLSHSEYNASQTDLVHFIQMWVKPNVSGLAPSYATCQWTDEERTNQLRLIVSKDGRDGSILVHQDCDVYASILPSSVPSQSAGASSVESTPLQFDLHPSREAYIHLIQDVTGYDTEANNTELTITTADGETKLQGGDGLYIKHNSDSADQQTFTITSTGRNGASAEFILFDVNVDPKKMVWRRSAGGSKDNPMI